MKATASTPLNTLVCRQASSTLPLEETLMKPFMILFAANLLLFRARIIFPMHVEGEHFVCRAVGGSKVGLLLRMCSLPFLYHQCPVNNVHPLLYSHNMCMCICAFVCLPKSCWLHQTTATDYIPALCCCWTWAVLQRDIYCGAHWINIWWTCAMTIQFSVLSIGVYKSTQI